jgi:hypothetical protein
MPLFSKHFKADAHCCPEDVFLPFYLPSVIIEIKVPLVYDVKPNLSYRFGRFCCVLVVNNSSNTVIGKYNWG